MMRDITTITCCMMQLCDIENPVVQDSLPDLEIHDGNGDAVVQDPPPDLEMHDEADASVDSVPRLINEDPGAAPVSETFTH